MYSVIFNRQNDYTVIASVTDSIKDATTTSSPLFICRDHFYSRVMFDRNLHNVLRGTSSPKLVFNRFFIAWFHQQCEIVLFILLYLRLYATQMKVSYSYIYPRPLPVHTNYMFIYSTYSLRVAEVVTTIEVQISKQMHRLPVIVR